VATTEAAADTNLISQERGYAGAPSTTSDAAPDAAPVAAPDAAPGAAPGAAPVAAPDAAPGAAPGAAETTTGKEPLGTEQCRGVSHPLLARNCKIHALTLSGASSWRWCPHPRRIWGKVEKKAEEEE
jgi:hypothetical protein